MGSQKHRSSETNERPVSGRSLSPDSAKDGLGRSYECTFCKRGFTNAQALGGHMNIHRKDKVKAKQQKAFTTTIKNSTKPNKDHFMVSSKSLKSIQNEEVQYLGSSFEFMTGDDHGCEFAPSNPNFPWNNLVDSQLNDHALHEEHLRVNLNLGIGTSEMENNNMGSAKVVQEDWFENEVDLELRLGHYP